MDDPCAGHPQGTMVTIWVVPGASSDGIVGMHGDALRLRVTAPPEGGRANAAAVALLVVATGAHGGAVITGRSSRRKRVLLEGITPGRARTRLLGEG